MCGGGGRRVLSVFCSPVSSSFLCLLPDSGTFSKHRLYHQGQMQAQHTVVPGQGAQAGSGIDRDVCLFIRESSQSGDLEFVSPSLSRVPFSSPKHLSLYVCAFCPVPLRLWPCSQKSVETVSLGGQGEGHKVIFCPTPSSPFLESVRILCRRVGSLG